MYFYSPQIQHMSLLACNSLEDKVQNNRHAILVKEDINDRPLCID
jgi:hypothetical protein